MENKGKQRIVGVLVIIALVVILLPLLFGKNEPQTQQVVAKAPAFPDQPSQPVSLAANDNSSASQGVGVDNTTSSEISVPVPNLPAPSNVAASSSDSNKASESNAATLGGSTTSTASTVSTTAPAASQPATTAQQTVQSVPNSVTSQSNLTKTASLQTEAKASSATTGTVATTLSNAAAHAVTTSASTETNTTAASTETDAPQVPVTHHTVTAMHKAKSLPAVIKAKSKIVKPAAVKSAEFKQPAWAIQMGNFKNKENALRLTNQLRAAGFKAFTRDYKLASGKVRTRVFIGPEFKQTTALALSGKVEDKLKLRGIVVSYKPLEL